MSYDRLAPFYTFFETATFGRALQEARCSPLGEPEPGRVLVLGDGNGRFLERAVARWPGADFVSVDASAGMLRQAETRVASPRVTFVHADVFSWLKNAENGSFDAVVTHFFLDCFTQRDLELLVPAIGHFLERRGAWFIVEFTDETRWQRGLLWLMYRAFNWCTETGAQRLPDHSSLLRSGGWNSERLGSWRSGFIVAQRWQRAAT